MSSIIEQLTEAARRRVEFRDGVYRVVNSDGSNYSPAAHTTLVEAIGEKDSALKLAAASYDANYASISAAQVEAHVILTKNPGSTADTYKFNTAGERDAFITGLTAMRGNDVYEIVDGPDYAIDSEGKVREFPPGVDAELPLVRVTLSTADSCTGTQIYGLKPSYYPVTIEEIEWEPQEPDAETVSVEVEVCFDSGAHFVDLDGDQFRALEEAGKFDAFLGALARENPDEADEILREVSAAPGARP